MIRLGTFHGKDPLIPARNVNFIITSRNGEEEFVPKKAMAISQVKVRFVSQVVKNRSHWPTVKLEWNHLNDLDLPTLDSSLVTILIGRDVRGAHQTLKERCSSNYIGPNAVLKPFGWFVPGSVPSRVFEVTEREPNIFQVYFRPHDKEMRDDIARLWVNEVLGVQRPIQSILSSEN
jgi:hypothetical protein